MWRTSLAFWESVSSWAFVTAVAAGIVGTISVFILGFTVIAAFTGVLAPTSILISRQAGRRASDIIQRESTEKIVAAQKEAVEASQQAIVANEKAEELRLESLRIQEKITPRSLSRFSALSEKLQGFSGISVEIKRLSECGSDVVVLSNQLSLILERAGWTVSTQDVTGMPQRVDGVIISISPESNKQTVAAAHSLNNELNARGIVAGCIPTSTDPLNIIEIIVGAKP